MSKTWPTNWTYRGREVFVSRSAQIPPILRPSRGRYNLVLGEALDQIEPWEETEGVIRTHCVASQELIAACVHTNPNEQPLWAVHRDHRSSKPNLAPFVKRAVWPMTRLLMVEFIGTPEAPIIVRAYPNPEYVYPLPTMRAAVTAPGGEEACVSFWRQNAYLLTSNRLIVGEPQTDGPEWWNG